MEMPTEHKHIRKQQNHPTAPGACPGIEQCPLLRESSSQNPTTNPFLQGDRAGRWGPVRRAGVQWVSGTRRVSLPAPQPQEAAVSICTAKRPCLRSSPRATFLKLVPCSGSPARSGCGAGPQGHGVGGWESSRSQKVESGEASPVGLFPNVNAVTLVSSSGREGRSSSAVCSWVNGCLEGWRVCSQAGR